MDDRAHYANPENSRIAKLPRRFISIQAHFEHLNNPRTRKVVYPRVNMVIIASCAVVRSTDDFVALTNFGRKK